MKKLLENIFATSVAIYFGNKIINEISWENRKEILKGKGFCYKIIWYINHFLG